MKKLKSSPLVSVIIPVYNRLDSFKNTLDSVVKQSYTNMEIIIVDDGSDNDMMQYIETIGDNRINYYWLEHNNANIARNHGILKSHGEYIAMLDSDDLWLESHVAECVTILQRNIADGIYSNIFLQYNDGSCKEVKVREIKEGEETINYLLSSGYGAQTSTLFMTSQSAKATLWDASLHRHQDYDFVVRYSENFKLLPRNNTTVIYKVGTSSKIDFESCISFIERNRKDITPTIYIAYNLDMLMIAIRQDASFDIIEYYRKESTRYKEYISLQKYISIMDMKGTFFNKLKYKLKYLYYILQVNL